MQIQQLEVVEILSKPRQSKDKRYWTIKVKVKAYGYTYETSIIKATENEIKSVDVGYTFKG